MPTSEKPPAPQYTYAEYKPIYVAAHPPATEREERVFAILDAAFEGFVTTLPAGDWDAVIAEAFRPIAVSA